MAEPLLLLPLEQRVVAQQIFDLAKGRLSGRRTFGGHHLQNRGCRHWRLWLLAMRIPCGAVVVRVVRLLGGIGVDEVSWLSQRRVLVFGFLLSAPLIFLLLLLLLFILLLLPLFAFLLALLLAATTLALAATANSFATTTNSLAFSLLAILGPR